MDHVRNNTMESSADSDDNNGNIECTKYMKCVSHSESNVAHCIASVHHEDEKDADGMEDQGTEYEDEDDDEIIETNGHGYYEDDENEENNQFEGDLVVQGEQMKIHDKDHHHHRQSIDNLNDSTNKYLNMLGEDLLLEVKDITVSNANNNNNESKLSNEKQHSKIFKNPLREYQKTQKAIQPLMAHGNAQNKNGHFLSEFIPNGNSEESYENTETDEETSNVLLGRREEEDAINKFDLSKADLICLVEDMHRTIEFERFEKMKLRDKYNDCIMENKKCLNLLEQYNMEREEILKEFNSLKNAKIKDNKRFNHELEAISREYSQVMSERDSVHKEMEAMAEQLSKAQERIKKYQRESTVYSSANNLLNMSNFGANLSANNDTLNELINNVNFNNNSNLQNNINSKDGSRKNGQDHQSVVSRQQKSSSAVYADLGSMDHLLEIDSLKQHINQVTRQRDEAVVQIRELHHQLNATGNGDSKYKDVEYANRFLSEKPNSNLRPDEENEMLKFEMKELLKEMENCQKRRDQAFNERDKMLKERESIRALCDEMRYQRDKAISELAEALHESDELKKSKTLAYRQIQMLEDNVGMLEEKLVYLKELEELKEEAKQQQAESAKQLQKSLEEDYNNWKTLRIDIDLADDGDLGIELSYAANIVTNLQENSGDEDLQEPQNQQNENNSQQSIDQTTTSNENLEFVKANYSICKTPPLALNDDTESHATTDINKNVNLVNSSSVFTSSQYDADTINGSYDSCVNGDKELIGRVHDENSTGKRQDGYDDAAESSDEVTEKAAAPLERLVLVSRISDSGLAYGNLKLFDRLLKVNDIDVENVSLDDIRALLDSLRGNVSFVISRHFSKSNDSLNRDYDNNCTENEGANDQESVNEDVLSTSMSMSTSNSNSKEENQSHMYKNMNDPDLRIYQEHQMNRAYGHYSQPDKESVYSNKNKLIQDDSIVNIKRNSSQRQTRQQHGDKNNFDCISIKKSSLNDLLLETGVYISASTKQVNSNISDGSKGQAADSRNSLVIGDRILSINGISLTNKNLYEIMDLVNQCKSFNLVIQKITPAPNLSIYDSSSSILTSHLLKTQPIQPHQEYFMVSQTLSNISTSTSNQKVGVMRRKSAKSKHPTSQSKQNRHSILSYQQHDNGSISSSSQGFMTKQSRPQYNASKQMDSHSQRSSEHPEHMNYATEASHYQPIFITREDGYGDARYHDLVKTFHSQNHKECHIQSPNGNKLSQRSATNSQSSMGNSKQPTTQHSNGSVVSSPSTPKKLVISDLMQFTYKRNINSRRSEEAAGESPSRRGESHRIARNNTAL